MHGTAADGPYDLGVPFDPNADELLSHNVDYAARFADAGLSVSPTRRLAIVTCMDSRMDVFAMLGLGKGEAHVVRNAGGVVTDDVIRSVCLSQRLLGTREVIMIHHTDCGLEKVDEPSFVADLEAETGQRPDWIVQRFDSPYDDVAESVRRMRANPFVPHRDHIRGFVYRVESGELVEVAVD